MLVYYTRTAPLSSIRKPCVLFIRFFLPKRELNMLHKHWHAFFCCLYCILSRLSCRICVMAKTWAIPLCILHAAATTQRTNTTKKKRRTSSKNCGRIFFDAFKYKTIFAFRIYRWLSFIQHSYAPCLGWQHSVHKASMWRDKSSGKGEKINEETFQFPQKYPFFLCSFIHSSARHIASLP